MSSLTKNISGLFLNFLGKAILVSHKFRGFHPKISTFKAESLVVPGDHFFFQSSIKYFSSRDKEKTNRGNDKFHFNPKSFNKKSPT